MFGATFRVCVMAGLVPAIHVFAAAMNADVDARHEFTAGPATSGRTRLAGHDGKAVGAHLR
jgi:hypothetical protein